MEREKRIKWLSNLLQIVCKGFFLLPLLPHLQEKPKAAAVERFGSDKWSSSIAKQWSIFRRRRKLRKQPSLVREEEEAQVLHKAKEHLQREARSRAVFFALAFSFFLFFSSFFKAAKKEEEVFLTR